MAGLDNRDSLWLRSSIQKLPPFIVSRSDRVNDDILSMAWRSTKKVEDRDPIVSMRSDKRIVGDPNLVDFGYPCQSRKFCRVRHLVVTKVQSLKGEQSLDAGYGDESVVTEIQGRDCRERVSREGV